MSFRSVHGNRLDEIMVSAVQPMRVLLVMDDVVVRTGLRMLLESWPEVMIAGEAANPKEALPIVSREKPDVVICGTGPTGIDSDADFLSSLIQSIGTGGIILLTSDEDLDERLKAIRMGVNGVIYKGKAVEELRTAISKVYAGELWLDRQSTARFIFQITRPSLSGKSDPAKARIASLTERERQIANLICQGLQNEEVGKRLSISDTTVRHHLTSIFSKIGVSNRLELTVFLYRNKFVGSSVIQDFALS